MCDPVSATLGAAALVGGVAKGISAKQQGDAAARAGKASQVMAEQAASSAEQAGAFEAGKVQMKGEALEGRQMAVQGSSGAVVGEGSLARTVEDTASLTAIDKETVQNNAFREAWGMRVSGVNARTQGENAKAAGDAALVSGIIGGGVNAFSAADEVYARRHPGSGGLISIG